jgi:hypothetical protein
MAPKLTKQQFRLLDDFFSKLCPRLMTPEWLYTISDPNLPAPILRHRLKQQSVEWSQELLSGDDQPLAKEVLDMFDDVEHYNRLADWVKDKVSNRGLCSLSGLQESLEKRKGIKREKRKEQHKFIKKHHLDLPKQETRKAELLALVPTKVISTLGEPYPKADTWAAETPEIYAHWSRHLATCPLADHRNGRKPTKLVDMTKLDVLQPKESAIYKDEMGRMVAIVLRNWCPNPLLTAKADKVCREYSEIGVSIRVGSHSSRHSVKD